MNKLICSDTPATCDAARGQAFNLLDATKAFEKACAAGLALAKRLGDGWSARVWENLGWHYEAWNPDGRIEVSEHLEYDPRKPGKVLGTYYSASIHEKPFECGSPLRGCTAKLPQAAIKATIAEARKEAKRWANMVEGL